MKSYLQTIAASLLALLFVVATSDAAHAQASPRVAEQVKARLAVEGRVRVLVELATAESPRDRGRRSIASPGSRRAAIAALRARLHAVLGRGGHKVLHEFADTPYVALEIDAATLSRLEAAPSVALRVREDKLLRPTLAQSVPAIDADRAHAAGFTGAGSVVAVIDAGVDGTHPFFGDRLVAEACFASSESGFGGDCPNGQATQIGPGAGANCTFAPQACRHGTHVAGIAVGNGASFSGVAPEAGLIAIQVFHSSLECLFPFEELPCPRAFESDIVAALEHVYSLRDQYDIAAVNMSLGGTAYDSACDAESPLFAAAINNLKSAGIATVAASGNDGLTFGIAEPACIDAAVSVGAGTSNGFAWFSNSSDDLDLVAPGEGITSSIPGGGFASLDGTSMAAPHVAGAWAVYKQAFPEASVDEALDAFVATGLTIDDLRGGPSKPLITVGAAAGIEFPAPMLTGISRSEVGRYGPDFTLDVDGSNFVASSRVRVNGSDQPTTIVDSTRLSAYVSASVLDTSAATITVTVFTPAPGGGESDVAILNVVDPTVEVDTTTAAAGETVTATVMNPSGWSTDWLALAEVGATPGDYVEYAYVDASATWAATMPQTPGQYEFRLFLNNGYTQLAVSEPITVEQAEPEPINATLTPNTTSAAPGEDVTVTLTGAPGGPADWLALADVDSPGGTFYEFTYVGDGVTERTWTVAMPADPGSYEFRLFLNNGYTQVAASPTIVVSESDPGPDPDPVGTALTPSTTNAAPGEDVTVTLTGAPGGPADWLALAETGSSASSYLAYEYVGDGVTERTWAVTMPEIPGSYEFRLFLNNGYTQVAASPPIIVSLPDPDPDPDPVATTLTPSTTTATAGEAVTIAVANAPGGPSDWLALAEVGSSASSYLFYEYVGDGVTDRDWSVTLPASPGDYEVRLFLNNGYTQVAVSDPISVTEPDPGSSTVTLTPSATTAAPGEAVTVSVVGAPGGTSDWLALASVGSGAGSYYTYIYLDPGVSDMDWTVNMPSTPGDYEFRLFIDNSYTQVAVSPAIVVAEPKPDPDPEPDPGPTTLTASTTAATVGEDVTVTLANAPGGSRDWLALARVGSAPSSYEHFEYVGDGVTDRSWTVNLTQAGDYEFRLFENDAYTQIAASEAISVTNANQPTLTPSTTSTEPGSPATVTLANAPGGGGDWLALAAVGSSPGEYLTYTYVGSGVTDRTWTVDMPLEPGAYEFRLFLNNGYTQAAVSPPVLLE